MKFSCLIYRTPLFCQTIEDCIFVVSEIFCTLAVAKIRICAHETIHITR